MLFSKTPLWQRSICWYWLFVYHSLRNSNRHRRSSIHLSYCSRINSQCLRGELDGIAELGQFADALEGATLDTIRSGVMTGDLVLLWEGKAPAQKVSSIAFLKEIRKHLEAKLS